MAKLNFVPMFRTELRNFDSLAHFCVHLPQVMVSLQACSSGYKGPKVTGQRVSSYFICTGRSEEMKFAVLQFQDNLLQKQT